MSKSVPRIVTVGGGEIAHIAYCPKIPYTSETVPAREMLDSVSGKGVCQAATMAKLGGEVHLISCVGNDSNSDIILNAVNETGVNTDYVNRADCNSATSLIMVDYEGDSVKSYYPGSNLKLTIDMVHEAKGIIAEADLLVCQLEIHNSVLEYVISTASRFGVPVVLNSSPALPYDYNLYSDIYTLIMNHIEAEYYTGMEILTVDDARKCVSMILDDGAKSVVLTLGGLGCVVASGDDIVHVVPPKVKTIDTTAAGDVFTGALCWSLASGSTLEYAAEFACKAAAVSVTKKGIIECIPDKQEIVDQFGCSIDEMLHLI